MTYVFLPCEKYQTRSILKILDPCWASYKHTFSPSGIVSLWSSISEVLLRYKPNGGSKLALRSLIESENDPLTRFASAVAFLVGAKKDLLSMVWSHYRQPTTDLVIDNASLSGICSPRSFLAEAQDLGGLAFAPRSVVLTRSFFRRCFNI